MNRIQLLLSPIKAHIKIILCVSLRNKRFDYNIQILLPLLPCLKYGNIDKH